MKLRLPRLLRWGFVCCALPALALPWTGRRLNPAPARAASTPGVVVACTRAYNVYLMHADGSHQMQLTHDGTDYGAVTYPWYAWSPDGAYLLLERVRGANGNNPRMDLLLLDRGGRLVRALSTSVPWSWAITPNWAIDGDWVAYVASLASRGGTQIATVRRIDVHGHSAPLWVFSPANYGAGGGPPPSEVLLEAENWHGAVPPTLQWSLKQQIAVYTDATAGNVGLYMVDLRTRKVQLFGKPAQFGSAALSPDASHLAAVDYGGATSRKNLDVWNLRTGGKPVVVPDADLPAWAPDGQTLDFVRRVPGRLLPLIVNTMKEDVPTYSTAIYNIGADGGRPRQVVPLQDAYGFGPLHPAADGTTLFFSRVDNMLNLWRHRLPDGSYTDALVRQYGPTVSIQRFDGKRLSTIARNAGRPQVSSAR